MSLFAFQILVLACGGSKALKGTGRNLKRYLCTCLKLTDYLSKKCLLLLLAALFSYESFAPI